MDDDELSDHHLKNRIKFDEQCNKYDISTEEFTNINFPNLVIDKKSEIERFENYYHEENQILQNKIRNNKFGGILNVISSNINNGDLSGIKPNIKLNGNSIIDEYCFINWHIIKNHMFMMKMIYGVVCQFDLDILLKIRKRIREIGGEYEEYDSQIINSRIREYIRCNCFGLNHRNYQIFYKFYY
jgi:hypothetical protein